MKIIEKCSISKKNKTIENEDMVYYNDDFCVVVDGATSKSQELIFGKTGGRKAAELIIELFENNFISKYDPADAVIKIIRDRFDDFSKKNKLSLRNIHLCASVLVFSNNFKQIWSVGDCQYSINGKKYFEKKKIDQLFSEVRSVLIRCLIKSGYNEKELLEKDISRIHLEKMLLLQQLLENSNDEYGYSVLSCEGEIPKVSITNVEKGDEIVMATDGYPFLCNTLDESETELDRILNEDPLMYKIVKSTKGVYAGNISFDDRTYIRFIV